MKYIIFAVFKNDHKTTKFEFEYETDEKLTLTTLIVNQDVVKAALRNCPSPPTAPAEIEGLSFERLRHLHVEISELKQR